MGGPGETVVSEELIKLANDLDNQVMPILDEAAEAFLEAEIEGEKFSQAGVTMQIAYPGIRDWVVQDMTTKREELRDLTDKLAHTAALWRAAENASTTVVEV